MKRRDALLTMGAMAAGLATMPRSTAQNTSPDSSQSSLELLIQGGQVVNADTSLLADVRIRGQVITEIGPNLTPSNDSQIINASNQLVLPGGIDPHTHLQGAFVDDLTTGTAAAVAGGITSVGTFSNAANGESIIQAMERSLEEAEANAISDVFFHASLWPPEPDSKNVLPELAAMGQPSHKVFMTRSNFVSYRNVFIEVLEAAKDAGVLTLMHCEDGQILARELRRLQAEGRTSLSQHYAESRPILAEVFATQEAVALCKLTEAPMHLVHLSAERALNAARSPEFLGLPLSIETRPLYLYFTEEWLKGPLGPLYVGQPPLRSASNVEAMWEGIADGRINMVATDHAPWMRDQKLDPELNISNLRPGVSDLRFMLPVLYSEGVRRGRITQERFVELTSTSAAKTFGLFPERGIIQEGSIADVTIFDPNLERVVSADDDPSRSDYTPFEGWAVTGWPILTIRRGEIVFENWTVTGQAGSGQPISRHPRL